MNALFLLSALTLFTSNAPKSPFDAVGPIAQSLGKLLESCVDAGMTAKQVRAVFGEPEGADGETHGPIGNEVSTFSWWYIRYDTYVTFTIKGIPPVDKNAPPAERVHGGIQ